MISAVVHSTLSSLVSGRVFPNTFVQPDGTYPRWPAIRYTIISSDPEPDICGTEEVDLDDVRVQLDVVAKTYGAAVVLRDQVITALLDTTPPSLRQLSGFETYDAETKTHRVVLEYVFQQSSQAVVPDEPGDYFGNRYFGSRYWGNYYWGPTA